MANNCEYDIQIKGTKENCKKWVELMNDYSLENHFYRIFNSDVYDEGPEEDYYIMITGDCAWSLESCCRTSGYTKGIDLFAVNTKALNLKMEAWSSEPGLNFQEHYIYDNGECLVDECVPYEEWYWDKSEYPTYEEYKKENSNNIPCELDFDDSEYNEDLKIAITGGFKDYGEWHI